MKTSDNEPEKNSRRKAVNHFILWLSRTLIPLATANVFLARYRIRLEVSSSNFPRFIITLDSRYEAFQLRNPRLLSFLHLGT